MSRKLAEKIAQQMLDDGIDTANNQDREFIISAARLVLTHKKIAKKIGREITWAMDRETDENYHPDYPDYSQLGPNHQATETE